MSFEEAYEEFKIYAKRWHKKQGLDTITKNFERHILPYFKDTKIKCFTRKDFLNWQIIITDKDFSNNFNDILFYCFNTFLKYCIRQEYTDKNILENIERFKKKIEKKVHNIYTERQFKKFYKNVDKRIFREFFYFMYYYGTRPGETMALRFSDVKWKQIEVNFNIESKGKRNLTTPKTLKSVRTIEISTWQSIKLWLLKCYYQNLYGYDHDYFVFGGIKPLAPTTVDREKEKAEIKANLFHLTTYEFRHSFATYKINKKVPIDTISKQMGHTKVSTTVDFYLHSEIYKKKNATHSFLNSNIFHTITKNFEKFTKSIITLFMQ